MTSDFTDREPGIFVDRSIEIEKIREPIDDVSNRLLIIYGESGVGKTTILKKVTYDLQKIHKNRVFFVNFSSFATEPNLTFGLMKTIEKISGNVLLEIGTWHTPEQAAGQMLSRICTLSRSSFIYLIFDTTELLQNKIDFWEWIQKYIVLPLAVEGTVKQIFAGRLPAPIEYEEIKHTRKLLELSAIKPEQELTKLIYSVFESATPPLKISDDKTDKIIDLIHKFSFGHPGLAKDIAKYFINNKNNLTKQTIEQEVCKHVIEPFIENTLFEGFDSTWREILWWAIVLDSFNADILRRYLKHVDSALIEKKSDYFLNEGLGKLKMRKTVYRSNIGESFLDLIKNITQLCLETLYPEKYEIACKAAKLTFEAIADELSEEPAYAERYRKMAIAHYQKRKIKEQ